MTVVDARQTTLPVHYEWICCIAAFCCMSPTWQLIGAQGIAQTHMKPKFGGIPDSTLFLPKRFGRILLQKVIRSKPCFTCTKRHTFWR
jgi:hypothetical protein